MGGWQGLALCEECAVTTKQLVSQYQAACHSLHDGAVLFSVARAFDALALRLVAVCHDSFDLMEIGIGRVHRELWVDPILDRVGECFTRSC